jgi:hypothetical protein
MYAVTELVAYLHSELVVIVAGYLTLPDIGGDLDSFIFTHTRGTASRLTDLTSLSSVWPHVHTLLKLPCLWRVLQSSRGEAVLRRQQMTRIAMRRYGMPDAIVEESIMEYCRDSIHDSRDSGIELTTGLAENSDDETNISLSIHLS